MKEYTLSVSLPGEKYKILKIKEEKRLKNRVSAMGLIEGEIIEVIQNYKKQPVLIFGRDTLIAIGRSESEKIVIGGVE